MSVGFSLDAFRACLALSHCPGMGPKSWKRLVQVYGDPLTACRSAGEWALKRLVRKDAVEAFRAKAWQEGATGELRSAEPWLDGKIILWGMPAYPELLRQLPDPPLHLYVEGEASLLSGPCLAMVGARKCTAYGRAGARRIARESSENGLTIVSGMALGIDRHAHLGGLDGAAKSVAVLGTGIDQIYPSANRDIYERLRAEGALVSEFAPGIGPDANHFPRRNRIISGLSLGVVVIEAESRSGSLVTADLALEQNREIFALPGQVDSPTSAGCHDLIRQGATLVRDAQDIFAELPALRSPAASVAPGAGSVGPLFAQVEGLNDAERRVVEFLRERGACHIDVVGERLELDPGQASELLLRLEIVGAVRQMPGMVYTA